MDYVKLNRNALYLRKNKVTPQIISELDIFLRFDKQGDYKWGASKLCKLLGEFKSKDAIEILVKISAISSKYVSFNECRVAAINALAEIGDLSAIPELVKIQSWSDAATQQQIIQYALTESLAKLGFSKSQEDDAVVFVKEYTDQKNGNTYRIHRANTVALARAFLNQTPITKKFTYWVVETPEGNLGRDINGIYEE